MLVKITARAWSLSILASLSRGVPGRQAPLLAATGAGRTAFAQSLAHLIDLGLIARNPGHGHPLRPEFRLTPLGQQVAPLAEAMMQAGSGPVDTRLLRRAWTVPILTVCRTPHYFNQIKSALPPITDRALSQSLKHLVAHRWVERTTDVSLHPPRPHYRAANAGLDIGTLASTAH
ncbi:MAG: winged helix-turn-helix transcriptional regulator [Pseudomonadota bacterium]